MTLVEALIEMYEAANSYSDDLATGLEDGTYDDDSQQEPLDKALSMFTKLKSALQRVDKINKAETVLERYNEDGTFEALDAMEDMREIFGYK